MTKTTTKYTIKCDECKEVIGYTNSLAESAAGGYCPIGCRITVAEVRKLCPVARCEKNNGHDGLHNWATS